MQEQWSLRTRLYRERSLVNQVDMDFHLLCRPLASRTSSVVGTAGDGTILVAKVGDAAARPVPIVVAFCHRGGRSVLAAPDSRVIVGVFGNGDGARLEGVSGISKTSSGTSARATAANEY